MIKKLFLILGVIFFFSFVNAITINQGVVLNTTSSNSSVTFSFDVNATNVTIDSSYVFLYNVSFTNLTGFYDCGEINHSDVNSVLDSLEFVCNITEEIASEVEEDIVESSSRGGRTFYPTQKELEEGYTKNILKGLRVRILVGEELHYVDIKEVDGRKVLVSVSSEVQEKWLEEGEEWLVEVTGDNFYDIYVKVNSISGLYVNVTVKSIEEEIELVPEDNVETVVKEHKSEAKDSLPFGLFLIIVFVVLVCFTLLILFLRKPKWERRLIRNLVSMKYRRKKR